MIWIFSIISTVLYWFAGRDNTNKLWRRLGCTLTAILYLILSGGISLQVACLVLFFALNFGVLTTYCDFLGEKGTLPSGESYKNETTLTWTISGISYGVSAIPLYWCGITWYSILYRAIALTVAIPLIRKIPGAQIQEALSGFIYLFTLSLLNHVYL